MNIIYRSIIADISAAIDQANRADRQIDRIELSDKEMREFQCETGERVPEGGRYLFGVKIKRAFVQPPDKLDAA